MQKKNLFIVLLFVLAFVKADDPEAKMTVEEVVIYHGYPIETHEVVTEDGYILTIHRIPYGKKNTTAHRRKPVIIQHGVIANSGFWVADLPTKNLPYLLADRGYDVFLPNLRGNNLSRRHKTLSPDDETFWDFTFNECAEYDLPVIFKLVLMLSGAEKFTYIGHSMGTTVMFIFLSKNPSYDKVMSVHALAPVAQLKHSPSPLLQTLFLFADDIDMFLNYIGEHEFLSNTTTWDAFTNTVCAWTTNIICLNIIFLVMGYDNEQFNITRLPVYLNFYPAGTSTKTLYHFAQVAKTGRFQEFDYGTSENQKMYKQDTPPLYDVSKITTDIYMYSGLNDWLAYPTDVKWLEVNLKTLKEHYVVNYTKFNHADFAWGIEVIPLLYDKLLQNIDKTFL